ncbi:MAG TPA: nitrate reductase molybdenum cofactor assembly chaperone [Aquabacterium sp.]|uniref:nitrate reductase molybdenum cofactor assembly chaperone n=1 Tax=Aquabacterium sp. TaxID=1872578 RepID=UPI002E37E648|nr:nitrate reductase molybdenum cofactor assembly chaperone [Aquabacterium sp.]HEX5372036.1 nitrate reductase molybdenum cofactor assembly chaperone [Aquabacterium sp.]
MSALPSLKSLMGQHVTPVYSLRALAHLLTYPNAELRAALPELREALNAEHALPAKRLQGLELLIEVLSSRDPIEVEAEYVELFDRGRSTSLHLFEHVHGDSRDRGPAMIDLLKTYEQGGLYLDPAQVAGELPDYLPVVLEFTSTLAIEQMQGFVAEFAHILNALYAALLKRRSLYAHVVAAVLELANQALQAVEVPEDEALDASWAEPEAFGGCSSKGQQSPDQPQPIQIVRRASSGAQRGASA